MTSSSRPLYNPSDDNAAPTMLPEHAVGFIDLKTLTDIHRYLNESEVDTDIELAIWIEKHYLYKPIGPNEEGRVIRTAEGFAQLDRAYRRVRNLTGKAQDKWPFFDRSWKTMSSVMVRNNSRGESAPGVSLSGKNGEACSSPVSKGLDARNEGGAQTPTIQVPFAKGQPGQLSATTSPYIRSAETTPAPLPQQTQVDYQQSEVTTPQVAPKCTELSDEPAMTLSKPDRVRSRHTSLSHSSDCIEGMSLAMTIDKNSTAVLKSSVQASSPAQSVQSFPIEDAGNGKIRGPNGRYLPKKELSSGKSCDSSTASRVKYVKKGHTANADKSMTSVSANAGDLMPENAAASESHVQTPATAGHPSGHADSKRTSSVHSSDMNSDSSTPQYTLAAEADPIASNLDKLPPGHVRRNKRKSEPTNQQGPNKRVHGEQSERGGAARQSRSINQNGKGVSREAPSTANENDKLPTNGMATRRTRRRSAINNQPSSDIPASAKSASKNQRERDVDRDDDTTMLEHDDEEKEQGDDGDSTADYEDAARGSVATKPAQSIPLALQATEKRTVLGDLAPRFPPPASVNDLLALGLSKTTTRSRRSQPKQPVVQQPAVADTRVSSDVLPSADKLMTDEGMAETIASSDLPVNHEDSWVTNDVSGTLGVNDSSKVSPDIDNDAVPTDISNNATNDALPTVPLTNGFSNNAVNGISSGVPLSKDTSNNATNGTSSDAPPAKVSSNTIANEALPKEPGTLEFIARIHSRNGITEIPLAENHLTSDTALIKRFAQYKKVEKEGLEVTYKQFSDIFRFTRKVQR